MKKNGFTIVELLASIVVLSVILALGVTGYNQISKMVKQTSYRNKLKYIETAAEKYASETGFMATNVTNLIELGYVEADNKEGKIINPENGDEMNCHIVTVSKEENNFYAEYTTDTECTNSLIPKTNIYLGIHIYKESDHTLVDNNTWVGEDVVLEAYFQDATPEEQIEKITWKSNAESEERDLSATPRSGESYRYHVSAEQILFSTYYVTVTLQNNVTYQAQAIVKIDKQSPVIYEDEINVAVESPFVLDNNEVTVKATDENGIGIASYYIGTKSDCSLVLPSEYTTIGEDENASTYRTRLDKGTYSICAKDKLGNISHSTFNIDLIPPEINVLQPILDLNGEDYDFQNNIQVDFDVFDGQVSCSPGKNTGENHYTVTCTALSNNGLATKQTFEVNENVVS